MHWIAAAEKDIATEHWVGNFKLDILCTDGASRLSLRTSLWDSPPSGCLRSLAGKRLGCGFPSDEMARLKYTSKPPDMDADIECGKNLDTFY
jgi:hypothetical protein